MPRRESRSSRRAVLGAAILLSRRGGLDSFSISDLGEEIGVSKSCIYQHFESRSELLAEAVLNYAEALSADAIKAAAQAPKGLRRLVRMLDVWLGDYVLRGGCLILRAGSESAGRAESAVSLSVAQAVTTWRGLLALQLKDAAHIGEINPSVDLQHLVFEVFSFALGVQHDHLFLGDSVEFRHSVLKGIFGRHGIEVPVEASRRVLPSGALRHAQTTC